MEAQLAAAARAALNPFTRSGPHCFHCPARLECPAARQSVATALAYIAEPMRQTMTPEQVGQELVTLEQMFDAIKSRRDAALAEVEKHLNAGVSIPTWRYQDTMGAMYWTQKDAGQILDAMGFPGVLKPPDPITPKQAIDGGIPASVVGTFSARKPGKKLVRVTADWARREIESATAGK